MFQRACQFERFRSSISGGEFLETKSSFYIPFLFPIFETIDYDNTDEQMIYDEDLEQARLDNESLTAWLKRLKKKNPRKLDDVFQKHHHEVFESIDCLSCGNCCKTTSPIFRDIDVKRIAKKLRMPIIEFQRNYLREDDDGDFVLQEAPCAFLLDDNSCGIYDIRPQACRDYPHTDRKKIVQLLELTKKNLDVCPAVVRIVNNVKEELS